MTINLTPDIQTQIYMDKKDGYLLNMVEKLTPKIEYEPKEKEEDKAVNKNEKEEKKEPFFKESEFAFNSIVREKSLNNSIGSTQNFFSTLSSAGGSVQQAS